MRVLACHNYYQQPGGEDQSFAAEAELLQSHDHVVERYEVHNDAINTMGRLEVARKTIFNRQTYREIRKRIQEFRPDILHCTNIFPLISPAAYYAANKEGVPVVQSLRNYRLLCPNAYLLREGKVCEACLTKLIKWPAVRYGCYRKDRAASAVVAAMLATHAALGTWSRRVDRFFAMTEFAKQKYVQAGFPAERISVKPNFLLQDDGAGSGDGGYAVFVGRLSPEKGLDALLSAWQRVSPNRELRIIGDGPMATEVERAAGEHTNIVWLGRLRPEEVLSEVGKAQCLVLPSAWYEGLPRTILEAYSKGTPVIAFRLGSMQEVIEHDRTGYLVEPNDVAALAAAIDQHFDADPATVTELRKAARAKFLREFSPPSNLRLLMGIYQQAIQACQQRRGIPRTAAT